tara:strand:+ start:403 stop:921 length:519 start_codon:yes stop_codon:yes gene_type:complete
MKYIIFLTIILSAQKTFCQASSSAEFNVKISFADTIDVNDVNPHYLLKNGNRFEKINYKKDTLDNSITIFGENDYVLWVSFPALVFTLKENILLDTEYEKTTFFYLYSSGPLSSFTGKQNLEIKFSYTNPIIIASLEIHNEDDAFKKMKIVKSDVLSGSQFYLGNEMIRINE